MALIAACPCQLGETFASRDYVANHWVGGSGVIDGGTVPGANATVRQWALGVFESSSGPCGTINELTVLVRAGGAGEKEATASAAAIPSELSAASKGATQFLAGPAASDPPCRT